jgi:hypothetical protein
MAVANVVGRARGTKVVVHILCRLTLRRFIAVTFVAIRAWSTHVVVNVEDLSAQHLQLTVTLVATWTRFALVHVHIIRRRALGLVHTVAFVGSGASSTSIVFDVLGAGASLLLGAVALMTWRAYGANVVQDVVRGEARRLGVTIARKGTRWARGARIVLHVRVGITHRLPMAVTLVGGRTV